MTEIPLQEYCKHIEDTIEQGHYAEAVAHGKHILKQYPKYMATYQLLGKAMLEAGQDEYAADMFRRVLSTNPEDLVAWVGMSEVHNQRGELDAAVWYLEQAFELAADDQIVEEELRHCYGRRDGVETKRVQLTRGALARLYLKGDLLSRAISEFRALLAEHPEQVALNVALAEALWRNEQRLEASEVCQQVLDVLPYCLKANLILGEIWTSSGREEGQMYLQRAEAVDPENQMAQKLFGAASPLLAREVRIVPLEYEPPTEEERPAWMAEIETVSAEGPPPAEGETTLVDVTAALEAQIEIPPWLEEVVGEEAAAPAPPGLAEPAEEPPLEEAFPAPAEEVPEWLAGIGEEFVEEKPEAVTEEETPEWLAGLGLEPIGEEEKVPERAAELGVELAGTAEVPAAPGEEEVPEWLAETGVEAAGEETAPSVPSAEQPPDWLAGIREQFIEEAETPEEAPAPMPEEAPTPGPEEVPTAWLEGEGLPSGDDALAWLEQLAEGKEEELRAQAQAEAEARMAEIMGRPKPAEAPPVEVAPEEPTPAMPPLAPAEIPDWLQELTPPEAAATEAAPPAVEAAPEKAMAPPVEEAVTPPVEKAFGWTAFGEPEAPPEVVAAAEEAPPMEEVTPPEAPGRVEAPTPVPEEVPTPAWLEGEGLPSGDEALAWLEQLAEGKEEELRAQAQAEAEARMAEIMGRPKPTKAPPVEAMPEEAVAAMEMAPPVEEIAPPEIPELAYPEEIEAPPAVEFPALEVAPPTEEARWGAALEVPLEEEEKEVAPVPMVEEVPGVVEMEITEPLEEAIAPLEIPTVEAPARPFAAERAYLKDHPRDYEARLALARALWQASEQQEALEAYSRVIRSGKLLESVIPDLEKYLEQWPDVSTQRVLGDAYMKEGRLQEALDIYRRALESL